MPSLAEFVDLVIGVDTHKHTHTAAIVDAGTGGKVAERTVATDEGGYQELLDWAHAHGSRRAWAPEGAGGYGAGLARFLTAAGERCVTRTDLPPTFRFHHLRHTGLSLLAESGASMAELQARAGHATAGIAMRYQHARAERDRSLAERLGSVAQPSPSS